LGDTVKISLSPDVERLIAERVSSGLYHSADEVVREGLELLLEREKVTRRPPSNGTANFTATVESIARDVPEKD
jgi:Arc/MetJ-type ribon-helix-helix transcriptional regulator